MNVWSALLRVHAAAAARPSVCGAAEPAELVDGEGAAVLNAD